jgi:outer membrane lipoprotein SlyB
MQQETKPAVRTTEYWTAIFTQLVLLGQLSGVDPVDAIEKSQNPVVLIAMAIVGGLYAVARGIAKRGVPYYGKPGAVPDGVLDESELEAGDLSDPEQPKKAG